MRFASARVGGAQRHHEAADGVRAGDVARIAAVPARDLTHERETEPGAVLAGTAEAVEGLEDRLAFCLRDAGAPVAHAKLGERTYPMEPYFDGRLAMASRVL